MATLTDPARALITSLVGQPLGDEALWLAALTHGSFAPQGGVADYQRLEFLRVLRSYESQPINDPGALLVPEPPQPLPPGYQGPLLPAGGLPPAASDAPATGADTTTDQPVTDGTTGGRSD